MKPVPEWSEVREESIDVRSPFFLTFQSSVFLVGAVAFIAFATYREPWKVALSELPIALFFAWRLYRHLHDKRTVRLRYAELSVWNDGQVELAVARSEIARALVIESPVQSAIRLEFRTGRPPYLLPFDPLQKVERLLLQWLPPIRLESKVETGIYPILLLATSATTLAFFLSGSKMLKAFLVVLAASFVFSLILRLVYKRLRIDRPNLTPVPIPFEQVVRWGASPQESQNGLTYTYKENLGRIGGFIVRLLPTALVCIVAACSLLTWAISNSLFLSLFVLVMPMSMFWPIWCDTWQEILIKEWGIVLHVKGGKISLVEEGIFHAATVKPHWSGLVELYANGRRILVKPQRLNSESSAPHCPRVQISEDSQLTLHNPS